ncbi:MAG: TrmB family transcriptional regulator [Candidatus Bathyarchaeia archaeon]
MEPIAQTLIELGLTPTQTKVFLSLSMLDCATVRDISKTASIHRQEIYSIVDELCNLGLIERRIGLPNKYKAAPLDQALKILLDRKNNWMSRLKQTTAELIQTYQYRSNPKASLREEDYDFTLISGVERFGQALSEWIRNAYTIDQVIKFDSFSYQIAERLKASTFRYRDDAKIRMVTCARPEDLSRYTFENSEVRFVKFEFPVEIAIYNGTRGHLAIYSDRTNVFQTSVSALTSNNPCFVQMLQSYFDLLWKNAISCVRKAPKKSQTKEGSKPRAQKWEAQASIS